MTKRKPTILTVGHSNHPMDHFLHLLRSNQIDLLVDVRSHPYSRFFPHFNKTRLESAVTEAGFTYRYLGDRIGGKPPDSQFYDPAGYVLYGRLARSPHFLDGIDDLIADTRHHRVAIMCAEEDPAHCHRRLLIAPVLLDRGFTVLHLRGNGSIVSEPDLRAVHADCQPSLFGRRPESAWRSAKPTRPPKN